MKAIVSAISYSTVVQRTILFPRLLALTHCQYTHIRIIKSPPSPPITYANTMSGSANWMHAETIDAVSCDIYDHAK
jgi:hypothetical protein